MRRDILPDGGGEKSIRVIPPVPEQSGLQPSRILHAGIPDFLLHVNEMSLAFRVHFAVCRTQ